MIGVVVPAKNEAAHLGACLDALAKAARHPGLRGERVRVCVVLDDCTDDSKIIARRRAVDVITVSHGNVGMARARGASHVFAAGARWLANTDADSVVAPDWLVAQLAERADAVCGTIAVEDWTGHPPEVIAHHHATYVDARDHRHIHGANLGLSRRAYHLVGGFRAVTCHEDALLVKALERAGARIAWSNAPRVVTSARLVARAPDGFAAALRASHRARATDAA